MTDPDGAPISALTADLGHLPAGNSATFLVSAGNQTGQFTWTPGYADAGSYQIDLRATSSRIALASTHLTVTNADRPPAFAPVPDQMLAEGETIDIAIAATDPDGEPCTLNFSGPHFGQIVSAQTVGGATTALLRLTPGNTDAGQYSGVHIGATSGLLSATVTFDITVADTRLEFPRIQSIGDVPLDQGGRVKIAWFASANDFSPGGHVDEYWVWRSTPGSVARAALGAGRADLALNATTRPIDGSTAVPPSRPRRSVLGVLGFAACRQPSRLQLRGAYDFRLHVAWKSIYRVLRSGEEPRRPVPMGLAR